MPLDIPDQTIATKIQTPDMFRTIGNILNIRQGQQALQQGAVNLEQSQRTLEPNVAASQAASELARTNADTARIKQPSEITSAQEAAKQAQIKTNLDQYRLTGAEAEIGRNATTSLLQDPDVIAGNPDGIIAKLQQQKQAMIDQGLPPVKAEAQYVHAAQVALSNPKGFRQFLANTVNVGLGASGQAQQNLVPASGQQTPGGVDTSQNPTAIVKDQFGNVQQTPLPVAGGSGSPPMRIPAGETPETQKEMQDVRGRSNALAAQAPNQHFNNQQILKLAPESLTGTGTSFIRNLFNANGMQWIPGDKSANAVQLQHFLALQVEQNAQAQGASTDAARKLAEQAVLPGAAPEKTIKAITKINDAYVTGAELFNRGLENSIKASPNGVFAARDFRNKWAQAMDPRIFQLENAVQSGDKEEVTRIKAQLGPQGIAQLRQKAIMLKGLIGGGNGP